MFQSRQETGRRERANLEGGREEEREGGREGRSNLAKVKDVCYFYVCVHVCVYMHVCMYVCMYVCMHIPVYHIQTHTHTIHTGKAPPHPTHRSGRTPDPQNNINKFCSMFPAGGNTAAPMFSALHPKAYPASGYSTPDASASPRGMWLQRHTAQPRHTAQALSADTATTSACGAAQRMRSALSLPLPAASTSFPEKFEDKDIADKPMVPPDPTTLPSVMLLDHTAAVSHQKKNNRPRLGAHAPTPPLPMPPTPPTKVDKALMHEVEAVVKSDAGTDDRRTPLALPLPKGYSGQATPPQAGLQQGGTPSPHASRSGTPKIASMCMDCGLCMSGSIQLCVCRTKTTGDDAELLSDDTLSDASKCSSGRVSPFAQDIAREANRERVEGATETRVGALYVAGRGQDGEVSKSPSMLAMQRLHAQEEIEKECGLEMLHQSRRHTGPTFQENSPPLTQHVSLLAEDRELDHAVNQESNVEKAELSSAPLAPPFPALSLAQKLSNSVTAPEHSEAVAESRPTKALVPEVLEAPACETVVFSGQRVIPKLKSACGGQGAARNNARNALHKEPQQVAPRVSAATLSLSATPGVTADTLSPLLLPQSPCPQPSSLGSSHSFGGVASSAGAPAMDAALIGAQPPSAVGHDAQPGRVLVPLPREKAGLQAQEGADDSAQVGHQAEGTSSPSDAVGIPKANDSAGVAAAAIVGLTQVQPAAAKSEAKTEHADPLDMQLKLALDFHVAGSPTSQARAQFEQALVCDLSKAAGLPPASFVVKEMSPGSIVVDMQILADPRGGGPIPRSAGMALKKQVKDPNSFLRMGSVTCHTISITFPSDDCGVELILPSTSDKEIEKTATDDLSGPVEHAAAVAPKGESSWSSWLFGSNMKECYRCGKSSHKSSWRAWSVCVCVCVYVCVFVCACSCLRCTYVRMCV